MHCSVHVTAWIQPFCSWTTVLSLCWDVCLPVQGAAAAAAAAFGAAPLGQWSCSALPSSLHAQRSQPECGNMQLLVPQEIPAGKWRVAYLKVARSISHSFSPLTPRWASNDITARQKSQFNIVPEVFPLPLPFFILKTFRGSALCLCTALMAIRKLFKGLSRMHITNRFVLAAWTEWISLLRCSPLLSYKSPIFSSTTLLMFLHRFKLCK